MSENPDGLTGRKCRRCGMMIYFAESGETGKQVPLQAVKNVWYVGNADGLAHRVDFDASEDGLSGRGIQHYVSHFETCPYAGAFNKGKKR